MTVAASPPPVTTQQGIRAATLLLAASSLLSRVLGYGRDWLIAFEFGATGQTDVYQASFTLPDLINYLLAGGALSVSLLPRMAELYARQDLNPHSEHGFSEADRAFSVVCSAMMVAAVVLIGAAWWLAEPVAAWWFPGFSPEKIKQTAELTRIVLPAQLFFLVGGLVQAALLARQRFRAMALTPLFYNGGIIAGGLIGGQSGQIEGFSWGALLGALAGGLLVPVFAARHQLKFRFELAFRDAELWRFLWIAAPLMIGVSLTTVDEWLVKHYGSSLAAGSITWLMTARRVMLVPIGLLGTAAGQATGTYLARLYAEGKRDELAKHLRIHWQLSSGSRWSSRRHWCHWPAQSLISFFSTVSLLQVMLQPPLRRWCRFLSASPPGGLSRSSREPSTLPVTRGAPWQRRPRSRSRWCQCTRGLRNGRDMRSSASVWPAPWVSRCR